MQDHCCLEALEKVLIWESEDTQECETSEQGPTHQLSHGKCQYSPLSPAASTGYNLPWERGPDYSAFVTASASKWQHTKLQ